MEKSILLKIVDIAKIIDGDMKFPEDSAEKCWIKVMVDISSEWGTEQKSEG